MSKRTPKPTVQATVVRQWAEENKVIKSGQRGRLGTSVIDAYNKANPKAKYPVTYRPQAEAKIKHTVTVERNGRKVPVTRSLPKSEVRSLAKAAGFGERGILPKAALDAAFLAVANTPKA